MSTAAASHHVRLDQPLPTTLLSLAVIALTAGLLTRARLPNEVVVSLSTGCGALVPATALKLAERRKPRTQRITELAAGHFARSPLQVALLCAGLVVFLEHGMAFIAGAGGGLVLVALPDVAGPQVSPAVVEEYVTSDEFAAAAGVVAVFWTLVFMVPIGKFVSHRIRHRAMLWIVASIACAQAIGWVLELVFFYRGPTWLWLSYVAFIPLLALPAWIGHRWALRTHELFLLKRLFRQLSEPDRAAVMGLMRETSLGVAQPDNTVEVPRLSPS